MSGARRLSAGLTCLLAVVGLLFIAGCQNGSATGNVTPGAQAPSVARGQYLADMMGCHNCHSPWDGKDRGPGGLVRDKLLSGRDIFRDRWATTSARNITGDVETGIGSWSDEEIRNVLTTGVRPDGVPVGARMSSAFYRILTRSDLDSVVLYLRSVAPVKNTMPASEYKAFVEPEHVPGVDGAMPADALRDPVKRGFYVATLARCVMCHTPMDGEEKARDYAGRLGAGGARAFTPEDGTVYSTNITSSRSSGLGDWSDAEIARAITQGISRDGHRLKAPMPYGFYAKMEPDDLAALIRWLRTVPAID